MLCLPPCLRLASLFEYTQLGGPRASSNSLVCLPSWSRSRGPSVIMYITSFCVHSGHPNSGPDTGALSYLPMPPGPIGFSKRNYALRF